MSSIICPLQLQARKTPDHPFIISSTKTITYSQADRMASIVAFKVFALSLKPGARVGVCAYSTPEHIIFLIGLWRAGFVTALMDPSLPIRRIDRRLQDVSAGYLFMDPVLQLEEKSTEVHPGHAWRYQSDQPLTIMFTSGTSAQPKSALHSFGNHHFSALGSNEWIPFTSKDSWFLSLPMHHVSGLSIIFRVMTAGGSIVMGDYKRFDIAAQSTVVTHASFVPAQLYRMIRRKESVEELKKLKSILIGGSAVPQALIEQSLDLGLPVHVSYGLTEMASQVATSVCIRRPDDRAKVSVLKYRQVKIKEDGEILVKGETLFQGYVSGDLLMKPFDKDGWFATGDLGQWSSSGHLRVNGRKDNMFISGGENIHPEEIEYHLGCHPWIEEAVVVPLQDVEFGQRPAAFVKFAEGKSLSGREMTEHLTPFLSKFKIPVKFLSWIDDAAAVGIKPDRKYFQTLTEEFQKKGQL